MSKFGQDPALSAYASCLEELAALHARVDRILPQNDPDQLATLIAEMRDLGRRLWECKLALAERGLPEQLPPTRKPEALD